MKVELLRYPTQSDWNRCKMLALGTEGKEAKVDASAEWKRKMLKCEHSPIRTLMFTIRLVDVPYWVSVHYVRHRYGVEHYVQSQRNDRQSKYDRNSAEQNAPVTHVMDVNAQELMFMARKRLCSKAAIETKQVMQAIVDEVIKVCPEFKGFLIPQCEYLNGCPEIKSCGMFEDNAPIRRHDITANEYQKAAMRTANGPCPSNPESLLLNGLMGLNGESGECIDLMKKYMFQGKPMDKEHLAKELGDVAWYLAIAAEGLGYTLGEIMQMNIDKLMARYPKGFEVEKSEHRAEGDV